MLLIGVLSPSLCLLKPIIEKSNWIKLNKLERFLIKQDWQ